MNTTMATKLINLFKYNYSKADPSMQSYYHNLAQQVRTELGNMNFMTGVANTAWTPDGEDWTDVAQTPWLAELGKLGEKYAAPVAAGMTGGLISQSPAYDNKDVLVDKGAGAAAPMVQPWEGGAQPPEGFGQPEIPPAMAVVEPKVYESTQAEAQVFNPVNDANARFAEYQRAATGAANSAIDAEMAYANSIINNGGIWKTLQPEYQKQLDSAISTLTQISAIAKANVAAQKAAMDAEQAMNYQNALDDLDRNLVASRQRTTEEMNQRGLFFSTVLDSVMGKVESASATQRGQLGRQNIVELGKIAAQMAALTANVDIQELQGKAAAMAQYGAAMLQWIAQDEKTKQEMTAILAKLDVQKAGVADAVFAQIFGQKEQMRTAAVQEGYQTEDRALAAEDRQTAIQDKAVSDFTSTIEQYSANYQAQIDKIANDGDTSNDWQLPYLKIARGKKIEAQVMALAESNAAAAIAEAKKAVEEGKMNIDWFNAITARINATGSSSGTTKYEKPGTGTGTTKAPWTSPQAISFKLAYEKVANMPIGTTIDANMSQNLASTGINLNVGDTWTAESKAAYLSANKGLYDSAMSFINGTTSNLWNANNPEFSPDMKELIGQLNSSGNMVTTESIGEAIQKMLQDIMAEIGNEPNYYQNPEYIAATALLTEFNKHKGS